MSTRFRLPLTIAFLLSAILIIQLFTSPSAHATYTSKVASLADANSATTTSGNLLIGNAAATGFDSVTINGDATIVQGGLLTISDNAVQGDDIDFINSSTLSSGNFLVVNSGATGFDSVAMSGSCTMTQGGIISCTDNGATQLTGLADVNSATSSRGSLLIGDGAGKWISQSNVYVGPEGNMGIGTNSLGSNKLVVSGQTYVTGGDVFLDGLHRVNFDSANAGLSAIRSSAASAYDLILETNNTDHLIIIANGNIGIGSDSSPDSPLEIVSTHNPQLRIADTDGTDVTFDVDTNGDLTINASGGDITIASGDKIGPDAAVINGINSATQGAGRIWISDGTSFHSATMGTDATIDHTGALTIADNAVQGDDIDFINSSTTTSGNLLMGNAAATGFDSVAMSGDCTMTQGGAITCTGGGAVSALNDLADVNSATATDGRLLIGDGSVFRTSDHVVITQAGNVGIGTTAPDTPFHVVRDNFAFPVRITATGVSGRPGITAIYDQDGGATVPISGTVLFVMDGGSHDGSAIASGAARIRMLADGTWSSSSHPTAIHFQTTASESTSSTAKVAINNYGNLGIGDVTPDAPLDVTSTHTPQIVVHGTTPRVTIGDADAEDTSLLFDGNAQDYYIGLDDSSDDLLIGLGSVVGTTPYMTITEAGNVGIGTTAPINLLWVEKDQNANTVIQVDNSDAGTSASARIVVSNDGSANGGSLVTGGTGYTGVANWQDAFALNAGAVLSGGLKLRATAGGIGISVDGGTDDDHKFTIAGNFGIGDAAPTAPLEVNSTHSAQILVSGTTPRVTIGDADAEDTSLLFDGNAQDYYIGLDDSADDLLIGLGSTVGTTPYMTIEEGGNIGIGTTAPESILHVIADTFSSFERTTTSTNTAKAGLVVQTTSSADMIDGFGARIAFRIEDTAATANAIGYIDAIRDGADDEGALLFRAGSSGIEEFLRITSSGNVGIGTSAPAENLEVAGTNALLFLNASGDNARLKLNGSNGRSWLAGLTNTADNFIIQKTGAASTGFTINSAGNLGLGTATPGAPLEIVSTFTPAIIVAGTTPRVTIGDADAEDTSLLFDGNAQDYYIGLDDSADDLLIGLGSTVGTTPYMTITEAGNVGIGTTVPVAKLEVSAGSSSGLLEALRLTNEYNATDDGDIAILFQVQSDDDRAKAGIAFERNATWGRGNLHFLIDNAADDASAVLADSVMTIISNGNVGIGTTGPSSILYVEDSVAIVTINDTDSRGMLVIRNDVATPAADTEVGRLNFKGNDDGGNDTAYAQIQGYVTDDANTSEDGYMTFLTMEAGTMTEQMRVTNTGNVGIGTTAPTEELEVIGDLDVSGCVEHAGGVEHGSCTSDIRLKKDIKKISGAADLLSKLQPVRFRWRVDEFPELDLSYKDQTGLIAQEVEQVLPELVQEREDGFKTVHYGMTLNMLLIQSVKELKDENEALRNEIKKRDENSRARNEEFERRLRALEAREVSRPQSNDDALE